MSGMARKLEVWIEGGAEGLARAFGGRTKWIVAIGDEKACGPFASEHEAAAWARDHAEWATRRVMWIDDPSSYDFKEDE